MFSKGLTMGTESFASHNGQIKPGVFTPQTLAKISPNSRIQCYLPDSKYFSPGRAIVIALTVAAATSRTSTKS